MPSAKTEMYVPGKGTFIYYPDIYSQLMTRTAPELLAELFDREYHCERGATKGEYRRLTKAQRAAILAEADSGARDNEEYLDQVAVVNVLTPEQEARHEFDTEARRVCAAIVAGYPSVGGEVSSDYAYALGALRQAVTNHLDGSVSAEFVRGVLAACDEITEGGA